MSALTRHEDLSPAQKAAALVVAVGSENADQVLRHLSEEEVEIRAGEVARLGEVDPDVVDSVMREVYEQMMGHRLVPSGGVQVARGMLTRWKGPKGAELLDRSPGNGTERPFAFFGAVEPDQLVKALEAEHPQ